ncbi:hypothetical protein EIP91_010249 [Steccherinum ochraceum]|uniref:Fungal-type protein kinase domain-containing protein n=1 Tax=Steccherinum ochraceum TaxID=92696 RepID=A0A4R0RD37_9APHY|nr:hypothetical protein EIP91_010249 [Steccherinum ochraceum]
MISVSRSSVREALSVGPTQDKEKEVDVARKLKSELSNNLSIVKMDDIIDLLYPVHPDIVHKVSHLPEVTAALARMPDPKLVKEEPKFYGPFVDLANVIAGKYVQALEQLSTEKKDLEDDPVVLRLKDEHQKHAARVAANRTDPDAVLHWVTKPDNPPQACEETTSAIRPDAACVLVPVKPKQRPEKTYWMHHVTPAEIKPNYTIVKERQKASKQLAEYMRLSLKDQLDRMFIFGLILCGDKLRVMRCDRERMLATEWIDINEQFQTFVRVILGLSVLDRSILGYDNTKKMVLDDGEGLSKVKFAYSTSRDAVEVVQTKLPSLYNIKWAIFVPDGDGTSLGVAEPRGTWYLTTKAISLIRAETMIGRGTLAWRVLELLGDTTSVKSGAQARVLKDAWQLDSEPSEAQLDPRTDLASQPSQQVSNVARVLTSVPIFDITRHRAQPAAELPLYRTRTLRKGLLGVNHSWDLTGIVEHFDQVPGNSKRYKSDAEGEQTQVSKTIYASPATPSTRAANHSRTLTRTLVEHYGWPLKDFLDLPELVTVVHGAVEGHQSLQSAGVLHRDVSSGNTIIYPTSKPNTSIQVAGYVIDLDHALKGDGSRTCGPLSGPTLTLSSPYQRPSARTPEQQHQEDVEDTFYGVFTEIEERSTMVTYTDTFRSLYQPTDRSINDQQPTKLTAEKVKELMGLWRDLDPNRQVSERVLQRFRGKSHNASAFLADLLVTCGSIGLEAVSKEIDDLLEYPKQEHYSKWSQVDSDQHVPNWAVARAPGQHPTITGTYAFMSYEISSGNRYSMLFTFPAHDKEVTHNAIHDMESFFWVLLRECLIRDGPGCTHRRRDLQIQPNSAGEDTVALDSGNESGDEANEPAEDELEDESEEEDESSGDEDAPPDASASDGVQELSKGSAAGGSTQVLDASQQPSKKLARAVKKGLPFSEDMAGQYTLERDEDRRKFRDHVYKLFEADDPRSMELAKKQMFDDPAVVDEVISFVHPYFERLRPMLKKFWRIMRRAHLMNDVLTEACIHEQVLDLLQATLKTLQDTPKAAMEEERDERVRKELTTKREQDMKAGNSPYGEGTRQSGRISKKPQDLMNR